MSLSTLEISFQPYRDLAGKAIYNKLIIKPGPVGDQPGPSKEIQDRGPNKNSIAGYL